MHRNIRAMRPSPATRSNQSTLSSLRDMLPSQVMPRNRRAMPNNQLLQPQPGFAPQAQGAQPQAQGAQAQPSAQSQDNVQSQQIAAAAETQAPESNASNGSKPQ